MKPSPPRYDFVVKDLFKKDGPTLLYELTGGSRVTEVLDPQFGVIERHADLVLGWKTSPSCILSFRASTTGEWRTAWQCTRR